MATEQIIYKTLITRVQAKLNCGPERISDEPGALRWSWWSEQPDFQDDLLSTFRAGTSCQFLEDEFREEVQAIRETLDELGHTPGLSDWQKVSSESGRKLMTSMNQVSSALSIWDEIGVPLRRRGNFIFRIWSPHDAMGSPIIKVLSIDDYISGVAKRSVQDLIEVERLTKRYEKWRVATILLSLMLAFTLMMLVF